MKYIRRYWPHASILLAVVGLPTLAIVLFLNSGTQQGGVPAYDAVETGYIMPSCTPAQVARIAAAKPLQDQNQDLNKQTSDLYLRYINYTVDNWKNAASEKAVYDSKLQSILDQQTALTIRINALIGTINCK